MTHRVVVVDLDGTLTNGEMMQVMWCFFQELDVWQRLLRSLLWVVMLPVVVIVFLAKGEAAAVDTLAILFFRLTDDAVLKGRKGALKYIKSALRHDVYNRVKAHQTDGCKIIIVSGNFSVLLSDFCVENDFELVATDLNSKNGVYSGTCQTACVFEEKPVRIKAHLNDTPHTLVHGYGNSKNDIPIISLCRDGTVVAPASVLRNHAIVKQWDIMH